MRQRLEGARPNALGITQARDTGPCADLGRRLARLLEDMSKAPHAIFFDTFETSQDAEPSASIA